MCVFNNTWPLFLTILIVILGVIRIWNNTGYRIGIATRLDCVIMKMPKSNGDFQDGLGRMTAAGGSLRTRHIENRNKKKERYFMSKKMFSLLLAACS